ncbi:MAG: aldo/keto reductase [Phycisphaeraceae bacterium JB051]
MYYTTLGRTNLKVSIAGLGGGGHSRLGLRVGRSMDDALAVAQAAFDQGVNVFDTAKGYGTEPVIAKLLDTVPRDQIVISTKAGIGWMGPINCTPAEYEKTIDDRLTQLNTDYIDVMYIHGLHPDLVDDAVEMFVPVMQKARDAGKVRFIGVTEMFEHDFTHQMLQRALPYDCFDVVMLGFNILNQTARETVLPMIQKQNVGTMGMFAIRQALSNEERFKQTIKQLIDEGRIDPALINTNNPLDFLMQTPSGGGGHADIVDACYRFCRDEPGMDIVLTGTSNTVHLAANLQSLNAPALPLEHRQRLIEMFENVDHLCGN